MGRTGNPVLQSLLSMGERCHLNHFKLILHFELVSLLQARFRSIVIVPAKTGQFQSTQHCSMIDIVKLLKGQAFFIYKGDKSTVMGFKQNDFIFQNTFIDQRERELSNGFYVVVVRFLPGLRTSYVS